MGRIDPPPPAPQGHGGDARRNVLLGIAAALAIAIVAYEAGRRASTPPLRAPASHAAATAPAAARPPQAALAAPSVSPPTDAAIAKFLNARPTPGEARVELRATVARPEPAPTTEPPRPDVLALPETPHDKMARCLSFLVENDEIHYGGYSPLATPVKVTVSNHCSFSFEGPDVSVEVRVIPLHGEGTIARAVGQFQQPIPSRGISETQMLLPCPRCDEVAYRFEARLPP